MIILPFSPIFSGSAVLVLPKKFAEIAAVPQSAGVSDICNGVLAVYEHPAGFLQAAALDILCGGSVEIAAKQPKTLPFA